MNNSLTSKGRSSQVRRSVHYANLTGGLQWVGPPPCLEQNAGECSRRLPHVTAARQSSRAFGSSAHEHACGVSVGSRFPLAWRKEKKTRTINSSTKFSVVQSIDVNGRLLQTDPYFRVNTPAVQVLGRLTLIYSESYITALHSATSNAIAS